jgi:hypothetical protein
MLASTMQNEAAISYGRSVYAYRATWCHIPEDGKLRTLSHPNMTAQISYVLYTYTSVLSLSC